MARSYRKHIKIGMCYGDNSKYYARRRKIRKRRLRHEMHNILANYPIEEIDEVITGDTMPKEDQWDEPTDGHWAIDKNIIKMFDRINPHHKDPYGYHKKYDKYLKPKHKKY